MTEATPSPVYNPRTFTLGERIRCLVRPEILILVPIYCLGLIPPTVLVAWLIASVERDLGLPSLADWLGHDTRLAIFAVALVVGAAVVSWSYTWLVLEGGGGPVPPFSARTRYLVTNGPYRYMRHPSIWGKLIGVIGLGIYMGSVTFLTVVIPTLLYWSLTSNMQRQDVAMDRRFGDAYRAYRAVTPRMVPRAMSALLRRFS